MTYYERLVGVRREFPKLLILAKADSPLMRLLGVLLFFSPGFMQTFVTTFGSCIYVPSSWQNWSDGTKERLLRHECVHLQQQKRYGMFLYTFLYLCFPLPLGLAWYRAMFEWEAYSESIRALAEAQGISYVKDPAIRVAYVRYFTTSMYGWMWPFRAQVEGWYDKLVSEINVAS